MDLWSRLIGGTGSSPTKQSPANSRAERLVFFKKICSALQQIWRTSTPLSSSNEGTLTYCRTCIERLNSLLDEESRKSAPYLCLLDAASSQIYIIITKLALSSQEAAIIHASARFFNILINGEAEGLLDSKIFARSLIDLARSKFGSRDIALGEREEGDLMELIFAVTTKMRLDPDILPAWFYPRQNHHASEGMEEKDARFPGATRRLDFPLFYLLVDHVYKDGRTGDFARTGLLYLLDTASKSKDLEKWMIESDLATLMASGLGALYSRLSWKLPSTPDGPGTLAILALSDWSSDSDDTFCSIHDFRHTMDAFLQYLLFWQDTLDSCLSVEIKDTLLDHFQVLFLQQVLYPSLLESSDTNGGSTAAVITYLCQILESLDHPDLVRRILEYLLASNPDAVPRAKARNKRMSLSRRRSFDALTALTSAKDDPSPELFNIVDLLLMSLKSKHTPTVVASMKLITVVQQRHHRIVSTSLIHTQILDPSPDTRKVSELNAQLQVLMGLAPVICDGGSIDQSYAEILHDVSELLDSHCCSWCFAEGETLDDTQEAHLILAEDDPVLVQLNTLLACFFANDSVTNLALTEAIISLVSCQSTGLDGWLLPSSKQATKPTFMSNLEGLTDQVRHFRMQIPDWEALIAAQRLQLSKQKVDQGESASTSAPASIQSRDSTRPSSSLLTSDRQSIEVPQQSQSPLRRAPPRTLRSEGLWSLDESALSSPTALESALGSPVRENAASHLASASDSPSTQPTTTITLTDPHSHRQNSNPLYIPPASGVPASSFSTSISTTLPASTTTGTTLPHVLVNAIILQEFILEVAALVQTRACRAFLLNGQVT